MAMDVEKPAWQSVYSFWFPEGLSALESHHERMGWWMRGGANSELIAFTETVRAAQAHKLDGWSQSPKGRLSLILLLDQFTRGVFAGKPDAYASDADAVLLVEQGLENGDFNALMTPWEHAFYLLPLIHAEGPSHPQRIERAIKLTKQRAPEWPPRFRSLYRDLGLKQMTGHLETILQFGRFPHRNVILNRVSTPEEAKYLATGDFVHQRPIK